MKYLKSNDDTDGYVMSKIILKKKVQIALYLTARLQNICFL